MAREIRGTGGVAIPGILTRAGDIKSVIQIENRLLDGSYNVQTIGSESTDVMVEFYYETTERRLLQSYATSATPITIIYDNDTWTGIIRGGVLPYEYVLPCKYKLNFSVMIQEP